MAGLQGLVDALCESGRLERSRYHVTLGSLIKLISASSPTGNNLVKFEKGGYPGMPHSYRGYYSDLSFPTNLEPITAPAFLMMLRNTLGNSFEGYKGGEFLMQDDTPLWNASEGCTGEAIMNVFQDKHGHFILQTKYVD